MICYTRFYTQLLTTYSELMSQKEKPMLLESGSVPDNWPILLISLVIKPINSRSKVFMMEEIEIKLPLYVAIVLKNGVTFSHVSYFISTE